MILTDFKDLKHGSTVYLARDVTFDGRTARAREPATIWRIDRTKAWLTFVVIAGNGFFELTAADIVGGGDPDHVAAVEAVPPTTPAADLAIRPPDRNGPPPGGRAA